jgi:ribonuclease-3
VRIDDLPLLQKALTHRSFAHQRGGGRKSSNERLEFLGDSVLGLVVSEHLFRSMPDSFEGDLTEMKSTLVSRGVLAKHASRMKLGRFLFLSKDEIDAGGRQRDSINADALEAVIGAIYLDQGLDAARAFIRSKVLPERIEEFLDQEAHINYKSLLQERTQALAKVHPRYRVRSEEGPDHDKIFTVEAMMRNRVLALGRGHNKKEAQQEAARKALAVLDRDEDRKRRRPAES